MELCRDDLIYLRGLARDLEAASNKARGTYVHLIPETVDEIVDRLREITDKPRVADAKPLAQRREKRG